MNAPIFTSPFPHIRDEAKSAPTSGIVDVFNYGRNREGLIPLWVGEGDLPTPQFICEAAARSLEAGETFYTYQRGIPDLRQALSRYHERHYGASVDPERFFITTGGMHAAQIAVRMVAGTGDEVLIPTPAWPNFAGAVSVAGARTVGVPLRISQAGWELDLDRLKETVSSRTRAIVINSPANPTGWTATEADLSEILAIARKYGLWIVADEIYARFVYDPTLFPKGRAPSFRDIMSPDDRILFVQTFSKNWAMTGWRLGWLEAPKELGQIIENLTQYSTSGTPVFTQRAALAALDHGDDFLVEQVERARTGRTIVMRLAEHEKIELPPPAGAFYAFLKMRSREPSYEGAIRLIDEAKVGLAPGSAFGDEGEGYFRLCFARKSKDLTTAVERLWEFLNI